MADQHSEDLRNVNEGDDVTLVTDGGERLRATCTERRTENASEAHQRAGIVRVTTFWHFSFNGDEIVATVIDAHDPDFPKHKSLWNAEKEESLGYVTKVEIHTVEPNL